MAIRTDRCAEVLIQCLVRVKRVGRMVVADRDDQWRSDGKDDRQRDNREAGQSRTIRSEAAPEDLTRRPRSHGLLDPPTHQRVRSLHVAIPRAATLDEWHQACKPS